MYATAAIDTAPNVRTLATMSRALDPREDVNFISRRSLKMHFRKSVYAYCIVIYTRRYNMSTARKPFMADPPRPLLPHTRYVGSLTTFCDEICKMLLYEKRRSTRMRTVNSYCVVCCQNTSNNLLLTLRCTLYNRRLVVKIGGNVRQSKYQS